MITENICYNCFISKNSKGFCPRCQRKWIKNDLGCLPTGLVLVNRYVIGRVLGKGGFGITYVAYDSQKKLRIAIKEFFPVHLTTRQAKTEYLSLLYKEKKRDFFESKIKFLNEAKTIAKFNEIESIVTVYETFEANRTAYMTMELLEGVNLAQFLRSRGGKLKWIEVKKIALPILDALITIHRVNYIHRDISPENIIITRKGKVKLIDFGNARLSLVGNTKTMSVVLKHGYAPYEQYSEKGKQGPWTDVYALCATIYHLVTGKVPTNAVDRIMGDTLTPPNSTGAELPEHVQTCIMKGLNAYPENRIRSASELKAAMLSTGNKQNIGGKLYPEPRIQKRMQGNTKKWILGAAISLLVIGIVSVSIILIEQTSTTTTVGGGGRVLVSSDSKNDTKPIPAGEEKNAVAPSTSSTPDLQQTIDFAYYHGNTANNGIIFSDETYIYYCDGKNLAKAYPDFSNKTILYSSEKSGGEVRSIIVHDGYVYFTDTGLKYQMRRISTNGGKVITIDEGSCWYSVLIGDEIIYRRDGIMYRFDTQTKLTEVFSGISASFSCLYKDYIFFADNDATNANPNDAYKIKISSVKYGGYSNLFDYKASYICVYEDVLYFCYNPDLKSTDSLVKYSGYPAKIDLSTDEFIIIRDDIKVKYLNVIDNKIYFSNISDDGKMYRMNIDGTGAEKLNDKTSLFISEAFGDVYYSTGSNVNTIELNRLEIKN